MLIVPQFYLAGGAGAEQQSVQGVVHAGYDYHSGGAGPYPGVQDRGGQGRCISKQSSSFQAQVRSCCLLFSLLDCPMHRSQSVTELRNNLVSSASPYYP